VVAVRTRDWATVDFYAVLGIAPTASTEEVGLAFRALAKELHPDRVGESAPEVERFKSVTAAYEVLGNTRLRRSYDHVRVEAMDRPAAPGTRAVAGTPRAAPPLSPEAARRGARRWLAAGLAVSMFGLVVAGLVAHFQAGERSRRAGRAKTEAVLLISGTHHELRFTAADGRVVQVPEPDRVNPGAERDGQQLAVLYRPDRPTDVILDESTTARDITLWIVAAKLLVGGAVFLVVGARRLRSLGRVGGVSAASLAAARAGPARGRARGGGRPRRDAGRP
jgi:hypothetical protein